MMTEKKAAAIAKSPTFHVQLLNVWHETKQSLAYVRAYVEPD